LQNAPRFSFALKIRPKTFHRQKRRNIEDLTSYQANSCAVSNAFEYAQPVGVAVICAQDGAGNVIGMLEHAGRVQRELSAEQLY
jgi:hypothetical protein